MKTVQTMLVEAEAEVPRISLDEAKGMLGRADVLFLDVREPAEVAASGKVPGAVAVPRGLVEFRADRSAWTKPRECWAGLMCCSSTFVSLRKWQPRARCLAPLPCRAVLSSSAPIDQPGRSQGNAGQG